MVSKKDTKTENKKEQNTPKKLLKRIGVDAFILLFLFAFAWYENHHLVVTNYQIPLETEQPIDGYRIVQIADFHNACFGIHNRKLLQKIQEQKPDVIVMTGDQIDKNRTNIAVTVAFVEEAVKICPVYYVTGNHEGWISEEKREKLFQQMDAAGAIRLSDTKTELKVGEGVIDLIGIEDNHCMRSDIMKEEIAESREQGIPTILLAHEPEWIDNYSQSGADLVLSGHAHGGQFRLPLLGGLVAPGQGFFPKYTAGVHQMEDTTMVISRGLGNSIIPVRLFNDPEIVVVELETK